MKPQLGIAGETLSDLSRAMVEVLTHHCVYTSEHPLMISPQAGHLLLIKCFATASSAH